MLNSAFDYHFYKKNLTPKQRVLGVILTLFGAGLTPKAPGTAGAGLGLLLWYGLGLASSAVFVQILACLALLMFGYMACFVLSKSMPDQKSRDDQTIVIDEGVGIWITLIAMPQTWWIALLAFALFRLFDIVKLFPCNWIDTKMKNAWGVMLDDVVAGIYANTVLYVLLLLLRWL